VATPKNGPGDCTEPDAQPDEKLGPLVADVKAQAGRLPQGAASLGAGRQSGDCALAASLDVGAKTAD
jgi:hypothetical protein